MHLKSRLAHKRQIPLVINLWRFFFWGVSARLIFGVGPRLVAFNGSLGCLCRKSQIHQFWVLTVVPGQSKSKCHQRHLGVGSLKPEAHQPHGGGTGCKVTQTVQRQPLETPENSGWSQPWAAWSSIDVRSAASKSLDSPELPSNLSLSRMIFLFLPGLHKMWSVASAGAKSVSLMLSVWTLTPPTPGAMNKETDLEFATYISFFSPFNSCISKT